MGERTAASIFHFCGGLRRAVLGGAARALGNCRGGTGNDSGFHGAVRDYCPADTAADTTSWVGTRHRTSWCGDFDEPIVFVWRSARGSSGGDRVADRRRELVDCVGI